MNDRDHFALSAMAALLTQQRPHTCPRCSGGTREEAYQMLAKAAYAAADAMLAERQGHGEADE